MSGYKKKTKPIMQRITTYICQRSLLCEKKFYTKPYFGDTEKI